MRTPEQIQAAKNNFLAALEKSLGIVTQAASKTGTSRDTVYRWIKDDKKFAKSIQSINEIVLDFAESALHKQINGGNPASTIFFLKTKGKCRGYVEKMEIASTVEVTGRPFISFSDTSKKEE